jgi:hypothetical protein
MFYDEGCFGRVELGQLPEEVVARISRLPGEWLEFDPPSNSVVVRHVEPTSSRPLPAIACELVGIFSHIPTEHHDDIPGGDLFVHSRENRGQLVRLRVERGGAIHIQWAHPEFKKALRRPYAGGREVAIDPEVQRLNGTVRLRTPDTAEAVARLEDLVETFEGLYPEGECRARPAGGMKVELEMTDVNVDAASLVKLLTDLAEPRSLDGRLEVSTFGKDHPEHHLRLVFEDGEIWVQHPLLWPDDVAT